MAATTIDLPAAYEAATAAAAVVDRSEAGKLLLTGGDAAGFLDGQVSNAIAGLEPGTGCLATLLTPKGKMLGDLRVLRMADPAGLEPDGLVLVTERVALQALFDQLRRGLIGWDVALHKRTLELGLLSLLGATSDTVAAAAGLAVPGPDEHAVAAGVVRTDVGLDVLVPAAELAAVAARLTAAGAVSIGLDAAEIVRVESGRPRYGVDLDDGVMPAEAGLEDRAVSFTKGCYVGQETVARLHWKGRPNRHLRGLALEAAVAAGDTVHVDGRDVGRVGSAVVSPRRGPLALALLRREVEPGDHVTVGTHATGAEVVDLPFA